MNEEALPRHTHLETGAEYEAALDTVICRATRRLRIFDRVLGPGFEAARRHELLRRFLLASRANRLQIIVHDPENIVRDRPRVASLLRTHAHAVSIHRTLPEAQRVYGPFTVADEHHFAHRFHYDDKRGVLALDDHQGARQFVERFEEILEASIPAVAATTLGL